MIVQGLWSRKLDTSESFLLVLSYCQLAERIIRFENYLKKATYAVELSEPIPDVIKYLRYLINDEKKKLTKCIRLYCERYERYDQEEEEREKVYNNLLGISGNLNRYHQEGLQWVFCPWPEKVTNDFLMQISLEAQFQSIFENLNGTNVLIDEYNFWECPIHRQLAPEGDRKENEKKDKRGYYIFGLPKIELENCLLWQTLLHEVGHGIIDKTNILDDISIENEVEAPEKKQILGNWIKEFGSDLIAAKTIGPSYLITLIIYFVTGVLEYDFWNATKSHPPFRLRIDFLSKELHKQMGDLHVSLKRYMDLAERLCGQRQRHEMRMIDEGGRVERAKFEDNYFGIDFLNGLVRELSEKLDQNFCFRKFSNQDFVKSHKLTDNLSKWILISSSPVDNTVLHNLREGKKGEKARLVIEHADKFNERPNKIVEIITAGTLCKLDHQRDWFYESFLSDDRDKSVAGFKNYQERLEMFDELIAKSIETAIIHSYFDPWS